MTAWTAEDLDKYMKEKMPLIYSDNGVEIGADIDFGCLYIYTTKYRAEWFWKSKTFRVFDQASGSLKELFSSPIEGGLEIFCQLDPEKKIIIYSSAEDVDFFIERLLGLRVFQ